MGRGLRRVWRRHSRVRTMGGSAPRVVALAGGVGGAKLAYGLAKTLPGPSLTVVGNTGDDETFFGLHVSPDLDTLMYTLAGVADPERGWGLAGESFQALEMLLSYQEPAWFSLGDRDLATHILRTKLLREGMSLTEVTRQLSQRLGVECLLVPMSDDPVRTIVETDEGALPFQSYFVERQCRPVVSGVCFEGAEKAQMSKEFTEALGKSDALVFCPSNPIVSIGPILAVPGTEKAIRSFQGPRIAVSPIIGDRALRGPAAKMLAELGEEVSCVGVARRLEGLCDILLIHKTDAPLAAAVKDAGMEPMALNTIMDTDGDKRRLAREICDLIKDRLQ